MDISCCLPVIVANKPPSRWRQRVALKGHEITATVAIESTAASARQPQFYGLPDLLLRFLVLSSAHQQASVGGTLPQQERGPRSLRQAHERSGDKIKRTVLPIEKKISGWRDGCRARFVFQSPRSVARQGGIFASFRYWSDCVASAHPNSLRSFTSLRSMDSAPKISHRFV